MSVFIFMFYYTHAQSGKRAISVRAINLVVFGNVFLITIDKTVWAALLQLLAPVSLHKKAIYISHELSPHISPPSRSRKFSTMHFCMD